MEKNRVREILIGALSAYLVLFLFLNALMFSFAFLINREACTSCRPFPDRYT